MNSRDCMNGVKHSLLEVDERLRELAPQYLRGMHREVVRNEVDTLLDQRNLLVEMLGELTIDYYEEMMTE